MPNPIQLDPETKPSYIKRSSYGYTMFLLWIPPIYIPEHRNHIWISMHEDPYWLNFKKPSRWALPTTKPGASHVECKSQQFPLLSSSAEVFSGLRILTFVSSKYGLRAFFMPLCMKTVLSGISPRSKRTITAHLLHWIRKPWAATGALRAACSRLSFASVYSNWIVLILPR